MHHDFVPQWKGSSECQVATNYYNTRVSAWEPFLESWRLVIQSFHVIIFSITPFSHIHDIDLSSGSSQKVSRCILYATDLSFEAVNATFECFCVIEYVMNTMFCRIFVFLLHFMRRVLKKFIFLLFCRFNVHWFKFLDEKQEKTVLKIDGNIFFAK